MRNFTCVSVAMLIALPCIAMADDYLINQDIVIFDKAKIEQQHGGSNIQAFNNAELDSSYGEIRQKALLYRFEATQKQGAENIQAINRIVLDDNRFSTDIIQEVEADRINFQQEGGKKNRQSANYVEFESDLSFTSIVQSVSADDVSMRQSGGNDNLQSLNNIKLLR